MIVSVTEIMTYLRCRQQWDFASFNRQGLMPTIGKPHFALGTAVHESLASWIDNPSADLTTLYARHATDLFTQTIANYKQRIGMEPGPAELVPTYEELKLGTAMMANYQLYYKAPINATLIATEQAITIPIPNTEHILEGTLDGLIEQNNQILILEHKTYNSRPKALSRNFQFLAYIWAARQLNLSLPIKGLAYDGMWKRAETPKGKVFSDLFHREVVTREPNELAVFEDDLAHIVNEMASSPHIFRHVPWTNDCWDCQFQAPCDALLKGSINYSSILARNYTKRERTAVFADDD